MYNPQFVFYYQERSQSKYSIQNILYSWQIQYYRLHTVWLYKYEYIILKHLANMKEDSYVLHVKRRNEGWVVENICNISKNEMYTVLLHSLLTMSAWLYENENWVSEWCSMFLFQYHVYVRTMAWYYIFFSKMRQNIQL